MVIRKTVAVAQPPPIAFRVFCEEIGQWWPLKQGFSFGGDRAAGIFLEGQIGGRFYERFRDGTEFEIGRVLDYQPPTSVAFSWRSPRWEGETRVQLRFVADGAGTRVEMEHSGWEQSPEMLAAGNEYSKGWIFVLAQLQSRIALATGGE